MTISEAQSDMRRAYVGGGPGAMISAALWLVAALVLQRSDPARAFGVLFVGGLFIFPLSVLVSRALFGRAKQATGNPLGMTALESTIAMIAGLLGAWLFLRLAPAFVFPFAAISVGAHYFAFRTVYGDGLFWALGAALTAIGLCQILGPPVPGGVAFWVAAVEGVFGVLLTARALRT